MFFLYQPVTQLLLSETSFFAIITMIWNKLIISDKSLCKLDANFSKRYKVKFLGYLW